MMAFHMFNTHIYPHPHGRQLLAARFSADKILLEFIRPWGVSLHSLPTGAYPRSRRRRPASPLPCTRRPRRWRGTAESSRAAPQNPFGRLAAALEGRAQVGLERGRLAPVTSSAALPRGWSHETRYEAHYGCSVCKAPRRTKSRAGADTATCWCSQLRSLYDVASHKLTPRAPMYTAEYTRRYITKQDNRDGASPKLGNIHGCRALLLRSAGAPIIV